MLTRQRTRALLATAALAAVLVTGACSSDGSDTQQAEPTVGRAEPGSPPRDGDDLSSLGERADSAAADEAIAAEEAEAGGAATEPADPQEQAVISTGTISLESDDVAQARFDVQKVVDTHGGNVGQQETTTGDDGDLETARLVLRVPSDAFAEATAALEDVGTLTGSSYGSEDVTTEVIDVAARIRAQEASVQRIEALLAEAENLRTLLTIERELSRRQAELDSLTSQQKWLDDQTSLATITVHIERTGEPDEDDDRGGFLGGLQDGWDSFVAALSGVAAVLGFLLPWLALLGLLGVAVWVLVRITRRGGRTTPPADPAA